MDAAQRAEMMDAIQRICGEHCVGYVFVAETDFTETSQASGECETGMMGEFHGGLTIARGLIERFRTRADELDRQGFRQQPGTTTQI